MSSDDLQVFLIIFKQVSLIFYQQNLILLKNNELVYELFFYQFDVFVD